MFVLPDLPLDDAAYEAANTELQRLPDLGGALMAAARAELPGATVRQLVIHAATIARRTA